MIENIQKNIKNNKAIFIEAIVLFAICVYQAIKRNTLIYTIAAAALLIIGAIFLFKRAKERKNRDNKKYIIKTSLSLAFLLSFIAITLFVKSKVPEDLFTREEEAIQWLQEGTIELGCESELIHSSYFTYIGKVKMATATIGVCELEKTLVEMIEEIQELRDREDKTVEEAEQIKSKYRTKVEQLKEFNIEGLEISLKSLVLLDAVSKTLLSLAILFNPFSIIDGQFGKRKKCIEER